MTTHSTTRTVLRALVAGLFAAGLTAAWPLSAEAGKSGGGGKVQAHDISVTKPVDRASPVLQQATTKGTHIRDIHIDPARASEIWWRCPSNLSLTRTLQEHDVRFGSKAYMCSAKRYVRFTPNSRHCGRHSRQQKPPSFRPRVSRPQNQIV